MVVVYIVDDLFISLLPFNVRNRYVHATVINMRLKLEVDHFCACYEIDSYYYFIYFPSGWLVLKYDWCGSNLAISGHSDQELEIAVLPT